MTLRSNSVKRSGRRRARRVSAGMNEDVLATDSGVFEAWSRRSDRQTHNFRTLQPSMPRVLEEHKAKAEILTKSAAYIFKFSDFLFRCSAFQ